VNNLQGANDWEQNCAYGFLHGGCQGTLQCVAHQCVIQWIGDEVEVQADEVVCIAVTESQVIIQGGKMKCLNGRDLTGYDYVRIDKDRFVPICVKPAIGVTRLAHDLV
jgi:hypothetical protein